MRREEVLSGHSEITGVSTTVYTDFVDEAFDFGLHAPVFEFNPAQLVGTHHGFAVGQWQLASLFGE